MNIYERPANRFVAEFVGSPGMNFIEGRVDRATRSFTSDGVLIKLQGDQFARLNTRERVTLGIRPENIRVETSASDGLIPATVHVTELMGNETIVFLRLGSQKIIARAAAEFRADMETRVWVRLDMSRADFFDSESDEALR
jgi:ABC-type sugar transport system ATPase subunit